MSEYPTPLNDVNLSRITKLKKMFKKNLVGLSDHTNSIDSSLASIPLGAAVIEKHFKDHKKNKSLDSAFSIVPEELKQLKYKSILYFNATKINNNDINKADLKAFKSKRSIFAKKNINYNDKLSDKNIISLRPKIGVGSQNYFKIIGKRVKRNISKDDPIFFKDLK